MFKEESKMLSSLLYNYSMTYLTIPPAQDSGSPDPSELKWSCCKIHMTMDFSGFYAGPYGSAVAQGVCLNEDDSISMVVGLKQKGSRAGRSTAPLPPLPTGHNEGSDVHGNDQDTFTKVSYQCVESARTLTTVDCNQLNIPGAHRSFTYHPNDSNATDLALSQALRKAGAFCNKGMMNFDQSSSPAMVAWLEENFFGNTSEGTSSFPDRGCSFDKAIAKLLRKSIINAKKNKSKW